MAEKWVLVTGASTGIGRACAVQLAKKGFRVAAGVRKESDGDALKAEGGGRIEPVMIDVTDQASVDAARAWVEERVGEAGLHGLVNNAGVAVAGPFEFVPLEDFDRQLQVNVLGQVRVTQAFIPLLRKAKGRLCFMGSTGGYFSAPFMSPYSASKFALEAFTDALRVELAPWDIKVSVVQPGAIKTPIWDKARADGDEMLRKLPQEANELYGGAITQLLKMVDFTEKHAVPPEEVAKAVVHAMSSSSPRVRYRVGWDAFAQYLVQRLLPYSWRDVLVAKGMGI